MTPLFRYPNVDLVELVLDGRNRLVGHQVHHQVLGHDVDAILPSLGQFLNAGLAGMLEKS